MTAFAAFQPRTSGRDDRDLHDDSDGKTYERCCRRSTSMASSSLRRTTGACVVSPSARESERQRDRGETTDYRAVPVSEQERERLLDERGFPLLAYVFTGFARGSSSGWICASRSDGRSLICTRYSSARSADRTWIRFAASRDI